MSIDDLLDSAVANSARLFELAAAVLMSRDPAEIDRLNAEINTRAVEAVALTSADGVGDRTDDA